MKAVLTKADDVYVISLEGKLDIESSIPLKQACEKLLKKTKKIVFNMEKLSFVGSTGIMPFVQTLEILAIENNVEVKFCKVKSEFKRIFQASPLKDLSIFEDQGSAINSYQDIKLNGTESV